MALTADQAEAQVVPTLPPLEQAGQVQQGKDLPVELLALEAAQPTLVEQVEEEQVVLLLADLQLAQMAIIPAALEHFQTSWGPVIIFRVAADPELIKQLLVVTVELVAVAAAQVMLQQVALEALRR
jgi:hypothetical protein